MDGKILHECSAVLCNSLDIEKILPYLSESCLLTNDELTRLHNPYMSNVEKVGFLIDALPMKGADWFDKFIDCLSKTTEGTGHSKILQELKHARGEDHPTMRQLVSVMKNEHSEIAAKWYELGLELVDSDMTLNLIKMDHDNDVSRCHKMFQMWLDRTPNACWSQLVTALNNIGMITAAESVRKLFKSEGVGERMIGAIQTSQQNVKLHDSALLLAQQPKMWELIKIVVPRIHAEWKSLAYCMRYDIGEVESFKEESSKACTVSLLANWLSTNHGPTPKTYKTLLQHIKRIDDLVAVSKEIEMELIKALGEDQ